MNTNPYARKGFGGRHAQAQPEEDIYEGYNDLAGTTEILAATVAQGGTISGHHLGAVSADAPIGGFGGGFSGGDGFLGLPQGGNNMSSQMRPPTSSFQRGEEATGPRPMTSVKGAGYTSHGKKTGSAFDPFQQANSMTGPAPPLQQKTAASPEHQARESERVVNRLIEESAAANLRGDMAQALEKAKEAGKRERQLCRAREKAGLAEQINFDLTYAVCFNLANQYHANGMFTEALNTYSIVVKNKQYPQAGRLRVNMGNIYYAQKKYPAAIKMYRMAMDQIGNPSREMRFKIMRNIGNSFVRLGQFADAIQSYEAIMDQAPDAQTGFNLIVCYYALGDRDKMKKGFLQLLGVPVHDEDPESEEEDPDSPVKKDVVLHNDELKKEKKERYKITARYVQMAAKLIAPVIEKDMASGFDWVIEYLKAPAKTASPRPGAASKSGFPAISMEMEIAKGIAFLKRRKIDEAIEVFKGFEKKDHGLLDQAATNLSFLYFLEGDLKNAERYADLAVKSDRYNAKALVNKANYLYVKGDLESAKELYLEAIGVEADCVEAIYNLGLANKRLGALHDALQAFKKLHRIIPKDPQVMYHIANLYDLLGENGQATEWFKILHGAVPTDPKVLARLGTLYTKEEDETQAFHNFSDSYNFYPVNMEVISWLGVWYVKSDLFEDAIQFFERASEIEPDDVKWQLMVASCYRRMNNYTAALELYKKIHKQEPENIECLKYLCTLCKEHNDQSYEEYSKLLRKAERSQPQQQHQQQQQMPAQRKMSGGEMKEEEQYQQNGMGMRGNQPQYEQQQQPGYTHEPFQPQLSPKSVQTVNKGVRADQDDEWGNDDLADDLLPL